MPQTTLFSGKRVRRGLYKTNSGLFINADINGAGNILRKEYPYAYDGQELSYLYETTKVVSYTDIYIGAKSLCNGRYNGKNHQSGMKPPRPCGAVAPMDVVLCLN